MLQHSGCGNCGAGYRPLAAEWSLVLPVTMATAPSTAAMNGDDHWFYSVSPKEKEARKQEVTCNLCISIIS